MMTTNESARDERAQRRAASAERATAAAAEAAKRQHTTAVTLVTGDGGTVMLATDEIRRASGDTPTATTIGQSGGGTSAGGDAAGSDSGQRTLRGSRGSDGDSHASGVQRGPGGGNAGTGADTPRGTDTSAEATISTPLTGSRGDAAGTGGDGGPGGAGTGRGPATPVTTTMSGAEPARPIIVREKAKSLKLTKFKGLDDAMPVTMWLKTVRAEVRRQAVTMGVECRDKQLYHEVASNLEGEAQRWFATVMESVPESEENINTLADMLRAKYMTQRTGPEVVDLLNARRQMRGERLVENEQQRGSDARARTSSTNVDEAVHMAVPHVGEYGEGYGVGLDSAMARWDEREAANGRGPLTASASVTASSSKEQSVLVGNFGSVVSGYGPMWGTTARPPRKARPKEVIPPLRSQGVGAAGDRWALDVAGPLPVTPDGNRYVLAAADYTTRYVVVAAVPNHTAKDIAKFILEKIVMVYGPMRELVMDGAPELNGAVIEALVKSLQAKQTTPVPYRPALLGLVERFHRSWKDLVALYVAEAQNDWDQWLLCAAYAYNGARHTSTGFSPNELMMGRRLRAPNELLRVSGVRQVGEFAE
ncbi:Enzymatic Polyprotein [Phytophthora cinnamomi]|uniref:Enzymatic Polyprotein n=1 Tax=Phytophthora cinnamomi TaxID=4785 RepID=UPI00355A5235|nr:Enzymatic Polyprotein [Phytophthora cinnamomi]